MNVFEIFSKIIHFYQLTVIVYIVFTKMTGNYDSNEKSNSKSNIGIEHFPLILSNLNIQDNSKFIVIKSTNIEQPLNTIDIFLLSKALNGSISENNLKFTKFNRVGKF